MGTTSTPDGASSVLSKSQLTALRQLGVTYIRVDRIDSLVTFTSLVQRTAHNYIFASSPLGAPYTRTAILTLANFDDWAELSRIARVELDTSCGRAQRNSFEATLAYPYLASALGEAAMRQFRQVSTADEISPQTRHAVLVALDQQRRRGSGLIEHTAVAYKPDERFGLHLGAMRVSSAFWVVSLLDTLLADGVVQRAPDSVHLRVSPNLTPSDTARLEWVQVGIMNFLYGNLFQKSDPGYDLNLGGGWYYRRL